MGGKVKREPARSFEDLIVWQKSHMFVLSTHDLGYCKTDKLREDLDEISRMLRGYHNSIIDSKY